MKVLANNYNSKKDEKIDFYPKKLICEECGSELEYEKSDIRIGYLGSAYIDCPLCGNDNMLEDNGITLTSENIEFPEHFYHVSKESGAVDVCNTEEIREYIKKAIRFFRMNKEEYSYSVKVGNLYIKVSRYDDDGVNGVYDVVVSNNYYETEIPFSEDDY